MFLTTQQAIILVRLSIKMLQKSPTAHTVKRSVVMSLIRYRLAACKSAQPHLLLNHPGGWLIKNSPVSEFLEESKLSIEPKKLFFKAVKLDILKWECMGIYSFCTQPQVVTKGTAVFCTPRWTRTQTQQQQQSCNVPAGCMKVQYTCSFK